MSRAEELRAKVDGSYHWCDVAREAVSVVEQLEAESAYLKTRVSELEQLLENERAIGAEARANVARLRQDVRQLLERTEELHRSREDAEEKAGTLESDRAALVAIVRVAVEWDDGHRLLDDAFAGGQRRRFICEPTQRLAEAIRALPEALKKEVTSG